MRGFFAWFKTTKRRMWGGGAFIVFVTALTFMAVPWRFHGVTSAVYSAITMMALAYPALRHHEQSRTLATINRLEGNVDADSKHLESMQDDTEAHRKASKNLNETRERLANLKKEFLADMGSWKPMVDFLIIIGYLFFAVAVALQIGIAISQLGQVQPPG